jgi:putative ABC transport system substrate-binding protein
VDLRPDLIIASPTTGALAAKQATKTIPIVFPISVDALEAGVVDSLARPGGNVTGLTLMSPDLIGKRLDLLKATLPQASRLAFLSIKGIPKVGLADRLEHRHERAATLVRVHRLPVLRLVREPQGH